MSPGRSQLTRKHTHAILLAYTNTHRQTASQLTPTTVTCAQPRTESPHRPLLWRPQEEEEEATNLVSVAASATRRGKRATEAVQHRTVETDASRILR